MILRLRQVIRHKDACWHGCIRFVLAALLATLLQPSLQKAAAGEAANATSPPAIRLNCHGGAQFEIEGPEGQRIFTDVTDTSMLSAPANKRDILLTTHFDLDHVNEDFVKSFPGDHLHSRQGEIHRPGLLIRSIASHHSEHSFKAMGGSPGNHYLFLIEMAGVRIAHFGDIGQPHFTKDQMAALGRVDIAISQFVNMYSQMSLENQKGYRLMEQVGPRLIIPHHGGGSEGAIRLAMERWPVVCASAEVLVLWPQMLRGKTTVLLMGEMAEYLQKTFELKQWP